MKNYLLLIFMLLAVSGLKAEDSTLEYMGASYENGAVFDGVKFDYVSFQFNRKVTVDHAYIVLKNGDKVEINADNLKLTTAFNIYLRCIILNQLADLKRDQRLAQGDEFKIQLEGVKDEETSEMLSPDGTVSLSLIAGRIILGDIYDIKPSGGSSIKPFYPLEGSNGLVVFTFSETVTAESAKISFGDVEGQNYGAIDLPAPTYSGSVVTVDLRGIKMYPSDIKGNTNITLALSGVKTEDGVYTKGNVPGSIGTYAVTYEVKSQGDVSIVPSFNPGIDANIDEVEEIECWLNAKVTFDAVRLTYMLDGAETSFELPVNSVRTEDDPEDQDAMLIYIPVNKFAFGAGDVKLEFVNAKDLEGYMAVIEGTFKSAGRSLDKVECVAVNPIAGSLESVSTFNFIFSDVVNADPEASKIILNGEERLLSESGITIVNSDGNKNVVTLSCRGLYGKFIFVLKVKDASGNDITYGDRQDRVTAEYTYYAFHATAIDPQEGNVTNLKTFTLTFASLVNEQDFIGGINPNNQIKLYDAQNNETVASYAIAEGEYPVELIVTLPEEIATAGTYRLVIPEKTVINSWYMDTDDFGISGGAFYNPEHVYEYTIVSSGISSPVADTLEGIVEVYSIQGVLLRKADASVALRGLPKGIYIVNGQKMALN